MYVFGRFVNRKPVTTCSDYDVVMPIVEKKDFKKGINPRVCSPIL